MEREALTMTIKKELILIIFDTKNPDVVVNLINLSKSH